MFIPIAEVVLYFFDPFFAPLHQFLIPAQLLSPRLPGEKLDDWICNILQVEGASGGPSETDQPTTLLRPGSMNVLSDGTSPAVQRSSCPANGGMSQPLIFYGFADLLHPERRYMKREGCPRIACETIRSPKYRARQNSLSSSKLGVSSTFSPFQLLLAFAHANCSKLITFLHRRSASISPPPHQLSCRSRLAPEQSKRR